MHKPAPLLHHLVIMAFSVMGTITTACAGEQVSGPGHARPVPMELPGIYHSGIAIKHYWISEKLDGIRARWDGTHLLSKSGQIIHAPSWFTQGFPHQIMDGELWLGRNSFAKTAAIVLDKTPGQGWHKIKLMLFDLPKTNGTFSHRLSRMKSLVASAQSPYLKVIPQFRLANEQQLQATLNKLVARGAEGLMLHHQDEIYHDGRSTQLLKLKKYQDGEATVIGYQPGKGKYKNMLGSLLVKLDNGKQFKIGSGFSDAQRRHPPPIGAVVTFKYYGKTARGIPRFASFMHIRPAADR